MPDFSATWKQLIKDLERERDELRGKTRHFKAGARAYVRKGEQKLKQLAQRARAARGVARDAAGNKAKALAAQLRAGLVRARRLHIKALYKEARTLERALRREQNTRIGGARRPTGRGKRGGGRK